MSEKSDQLVCFATCYGCSKRDGEEFDEEDNMSLDLAEPHGNDRGGGAQYEQILNGTGIQIIISGDPDSENCSEQASSVSET